VTSSSRSFHETPHERLVPTSTAWPRCQKLIKPPPPTSLGTSTSVVEDVKRNWDRIKEESG
jgi:hypothetical protein